MKLVLKPLVERLPGAGAILVALAEQVGRQAGGEGEEGSRPGHDSVWFREGGSTVRSLAWCIPFSTVVPRGDHRALLDRF